ncbi:MAG: (d)CMP kinase [Propionibacteriaceae bacterium]
MSAIVAIDGPSGSGKSTAARLTAQRLGFGYLDTGAMYRGVAVACLRDLVDHDDAAAIASRTRTVVLDISTDPDDQRLFVDGVDATAAIREPRVSAWVSAVSTNAESRAELVRRQREIVADGRFVVEGRDITTVVCPEAAVRVLLVADPVRRMARRAAELGNGVDSTALHDQVIRRDRDDSRLVNFTDAAPGVTVIDSTDLTIEEVVRRIVELAREAGLA